MRYEGPIYRPPSEADSLLIQATIGCPHNRCTFCMVYRGGPRFRVRDLTDIEADLRQAREIHGPDVRTLFLPAGNTIAMPTEALCTVCRTAHRIFPNLERITVYGSSPFIHRKRLEGLKRLAETGLTRIHVGLESGDDRILRRIAKGTDSNQQIDAGHWVKAAGIELSLYVILGIGGQKHSESHARETARVLNAIAPDFTRLRTFVPKVGTPLLEDVRNRRFRMLGPHDVLKETALLLTHLKISTTLTSDHYTNYLNLEGHLPKDKERLLSTIATALTREETSFRPFFIGNQ
ncbi:radical SAM protein [Olavius algarvensis associated proteobacterium Delta 3]|nr:radical SAM protein [Olavius algarvensis associated proteobacterium Delta 3]